ncbi:MAG: DUF348 domain-containing protein [Chloroflexi bacterium]|nr:DUF348 domain-containing protein [Chloroflexota bacterium]
MAVGCQTAVPPANDVLAIADEPGTPALSGDQRSPVEAAVLATIPPAPQPVTLHIGNEVRLLWTQQTSLGAFLAEAGVLAGPTEQVYADDVLVPLAALNRTPLPDMVEIGRYLTVTIEDVGQQQVLNTAVATVGEALQEAGISLFAADQVEPDLDSDLVEGMRIQVRRSFPLTIQADGRIIQTRSAHTNSHDALAEAGIALVEGDYAEPGPDTLLQPDSVIRVVRVTEDFRIEDEPIAYQTLWQASPELDLDTQAVISVGTPGIRRRRFRIRYENGAAVGEELDGEWVEAEPVNEVVGYGTRIVTGIVQTEQGPREYWRVVRMRATSYTAASSGKAPDDPNYGITASGLPAGYGVVAIDRNIVPWKSELFVPGYGVAIAGDTGGGVRGRWIDLGYPDDAYESWSGYVDVYYLTPIPAPEDINYLLPSVLP